MLLFFMLFKYSIQAIDSYLIILLIKISEKYTFMEVSYEKKTYQKKTYQKNSN